MPPKFLAISVYPLLTKILTGNTSTEDWQDMTLRYILYYVWTYMRHPQKTGKSDMRYILYYIWDIHRRQTRHEVHTVLCMDIHETSTEDRQDMKCHSTQDPLGRAHTRVNLTGHPSIEPPASHCVRHNRIVDDPLSYLPASETIPSLIRTVNLFSPL